MFGIVQGLSPNQNQYIHVLMCLNSLFFKKTSYNSNMQTHITQLNLIVPPQDPV
jgi:hypothetical protein